MQFGVPEALANVLELARADAESAAMRARETAATYAALVGYVVRVVAPDQEGTFRYDAATHTITLAPEAGAQREPRENGAPQAG